MGVLCAPSLPLTTGSHAHDTCKRQLTGGLSTHQPRAEAHFGLAAALHSPLMTIINDGSF